MRKDKEMSLRVTIITTKNLLDLQLGQYILLVKTNPLVIMESVERANLFARAKRIDYSGPIFVCISGEK